MNIETFYMIPYTGTEVVPINLNEEPISYESAFEAQLFN